MKVFVETGCGSSFEIQVDYLDTVLEVKQKIEKSQRIPVPDQILSFDGMVLPDEDDLHDIEKGQIFHESRIQLFVSPDHNLNHGQTEQSPPSNSTEGIIQGHQDSTVAAEIEQTEEIMGVHRYSTVKVETEQKEEIIDGHQDSTMMVQTEQTEEIIDCHQDSTEQREEITEEGHQDSTLTEQSSDSPVEVRSKNRVPEKKIVVYVSPYSRDRESESAKGIPVDVKMSDNVKELRNELVKLEEIGDLNLPQEGYVLIHKNRLLDENHSFWVAGVHHTDKIEILPKHLTHGYLSNPDS